MLVVEHITKYYGAHAAVSDLSLTVEAGRIVGLLGLNGAGKTTILRILSGLLVPTSGRVLVDGIDMAHDPAAVMRRVGFLPETPPLYPEMTVADFLCFAARIKGVRGGAESQVNAAIEATGLTEVRHLRLGTLSYGFRKRVGIAQALVHRPGLILLDEPTSGLDPVQIVQMRELLQRLSGRHTIIVSSHVLSEIHALCDRLCVLQAGRLVAEGTEAALARRVTGVTRVRVEVRATGTALNQLLSNSGHVANYAFDGVQDDCARATVVLHGDGREALAAEIVDAGMGLRVLEPVELELEGVFMSLTQDEEAPQVIASSLVGEEGLS